MTGILNLLAGAVSSVVKDTYFNLVSLLLPGDGTNGAQNNTFLDSSSNNFTITRNGNTTQGTFSPFSQTGWSNYFDGTGDYLQAASGSSTSFGTGDFCVECWFYKTSSASTGGYLIANLESNSDAQWALMITSTDVIRWQGWNTLWLQPAAPAINQWNHVAVCRSGTTLSLFVNGSRSATLSSHSNNYSATTDVRVGAYASGTDPFTGYISNARVIKGSTPYDPTLTTLTVPTAPLTAITNTSLLTCQSNRFIDNSTNAFAITRNGDTSVQAFSPFAPTAAYSAATVGGSGYFDGTGDFLSYATGGSSAFDLSSGDWTVEAWVYRNASGASHQIISLFNSAGSNSGLSIKINSSNLVQVDNGVTGTTAAGTVSANTWVHVAVVRSSGNTQIYVNGTAAGSAITQAANTAQFFRIGITANDLDAFNGYIAGLRIIKGQALASGNFTPPTAPVTTTAVGWTGANAASSITGTVSLLTNFANAGITDATAKNDLETVGNAQISTTQSKFGGSSMYFDGVGDNLTIPSSPLRALGTSDFTIEFWFNASSIPQFAAILDMRNPNTDNIGFDIMFYFYKISFGTATSVYIAGTTTLSTGTWYHYALTRSGNTFKQFLNGTQEGTTYTGSSTQNFTNTLLKIADGSNGPYTGYLDDIRITRGYARYTSNFTPPTAAYPTQ